MSALSANFPAIAPSLNLDFANTKRLDPRITFTRASTATFYDGVTVAKAEENLLINSAQPINLGWSINKGYAGTLGSELVVNGDFSSSAGWTIGNGWSISGGVATANTTLNAERLSRSYSGANNKSYLVTATFTMLATPDSSATVRINVGGTGENVFAVSQSGLISGSTYTINAVVRPTAVSVFNVAIGSNLNYAMNYTIDNVSVKEVISDNITAPDGTSTAVTLTSTEANATYTQSVTAIAASYTFSVYLRRVTGTGNIDITCDSAGTWVTQTITSSWARYTVTQTLAAGTRTPGIRIVTSGDVVEMWGAQLEQRSNVTAYTATTTQPITNYIPALRTAAAGVARFDHNPTTGESLGLLIEEQRANLLTYSDDFSNAAWTKSNATITSNTVVAPDGTLTGDKLVENTSNTTHYVGLVPSGSNTIRAFSVFAKAAERRYVSLSCGYAVGAWVSAMFDLQTGTITEQRFAGSAPTVSIVNVGNGWYRLIIIHPAFAGTNSANISTSISATSTDNYGIPVYTGDGFSGIYIWGAQLEAGAFPTSYIPTVASSVTRAADNASMTGTNFSSWYRPDEGTMYCESSLSPKSSGKYFELAESGTVYTVSSSQTSSTNLNFTAYTNGATQASFNITVSSAFKQAFAYKTNDFAGVVNNGTVSTDTSGVVPSSNALYIGKYFADNNYQLNGTIKKIAYYPQRLTNAQLQALTS